MTSDSFSRRQLKSPFKNSSYAITNRPFTAPKSLYNSQLPYVV